MHAPDVIAAQKDAVKPGAPASVPTIGHMNGFHKSARRPKIFQRKSRIFGRRLFLYLESMHRTIEPAILYLGIAMEKGKPQRQCNWSAALSGFRTHSSERADSARY